jgi:hypothetical protein
MIVVAACCAWAIVAAPPRIRFYLLWVLVTLTPFAGFRAGLTSRYFYLPAADFAALTAELLWWAREKIDGRRQGTARLVWFVITAALIVRCGAFAARNARVWGDAQVVYSTYANRVRETYPSLTRGTVITVPAPPPELPAHHIPALLRWTYDDPTLRVTVAGE